MTTIRTWTRRMAVVSMLALGGVTVEAARASGEHGHVEKRHDGRHHDGHGHDSHDAPDCQVVMRDSLNGFTTILTAETKKGRHGKRTFEIASQYVWETEVTARFENRHAPMQTDVGVPHDSLDGIRERFDEEVDAFDKDGVVHIDDQLTYVILPDADCSKDEFALIHFFVVEWFFYG